MAAYRGTDSQPSVWAEDFVCIFYEDLREKLVWDWIDRAVKNTGAAPPIAFDGGRPTPTNAADQLSIARLYFQKRYFADREAVTHARERAQRQVLAQEWKEPTEIDTEAGEMEMVRRSRESTQAPRQQPARKPSGKITPDTPLPFGKYKGQKLSDIVQTNPQYVEWMADNGNNDDIRQAAKKALSVLSATEAPVTATAAPEASAPAAAPAATAAAPAATAAPPTATLTATPTAPTATRTDTVTGRAPHEQIIATFKLWPVPLDEHIAAYNEILTKMLKRSVDLRNPPDMAGESIGRLAAHILEIHRVYEDFAERIAEEKGMPDIDDAKLLALDWLHGAAQAEGIRSYMDPGLTVKHLGRIQEKISQLETSTICSLELPF